MNLVKKKEKRQRHEGLIGDEFQRQVEYLNQFLPVEHNIRYVHLDMARCKKRKDAEVMQTLADIATHAVSGTMIYQRRPEEFGSRIGKTPLIDAYREQVPVPFIPLLLSLGLVGVLHGALITLIRTLDRGRYYFYLALNRVYLSECRNMIRSFAGI